MIESAVTGMVVDAFLSKRVMSHTLSINVEQDLIDGVKTGLFLTTQILMSIIRRAGK